MAETPPDQGADPNSWPPDGRRSRVAIRVTPEAERMMAAHISQYTSDLTDEAVRLARRRGASDIVSQADVRRAAEKLYARPQDRRFQFVGSFGSLLLGAALGNALQIAGAAQVSAESALLTFAAGAIGAAMSVLGFVRER